jgi:hypothetical protein
MNSLLTNNLWRRVLLRSQPLFIGACPWLKRSCWSSTTNKFCDGQVVSQGSIVTKPQEDFKEQNR